VFVWIFPEAPLGLESFWKHFRLNFPQSIAVWIQGFPEAFPLGFSETFLFGFFPQHLNDWFV